MNVNEKITRWSQVVERALFLYQHRDDITYCLGCAGEVVGRDKKVESSFRYYYAHGYKEKIDNSVQYGWISSNVDEAWKRWSTKYAGKMAYDCSGYIDWCAGYMGNHCWSSWNFQSMPVGHGAGCACWKQGHVGINIGYNNFLHIPTWGRTIELVRFDEYNWTDEHMIQGIDYNGCI